MGNLLTSLSKTIHASLALALILFLGLFYGNGGFDFGIDFWMWLTRLTHVIVAIMWIGLLWYFNFVQIPNMPKIPDEQKPAIGKVIAPAALFYFRWAALLTVLSGLILAHLNGYLHDAMTLSISSGIEGNVPKHTAIGIGMWLGLYMAFNVWFIIWPNQKRALGIVDCEPDVKAKSARTAMLFSRTNTLLSIPMLLTMVAAQNLYY
ncbi:urate hydroxylase PuuD [Candidatus Pelagibacter sp.]|nr:urate hydroxylase PuuD [Candidatus Pelagibacter sp.]